MNPQFKFLPIDSFLLLYKSLPKKDNYEMIDSFEERTIETIRLSRIDACKTYLVPKQPEWARLDECDCSAYPRNYFYEFRTIWWMNLKVPPLINVAWNTQTHNYVMQKNVFCSKIWQEIYHFLCKTNDKSSMELIDCSVSTIPP